MPGMKVTVTGGTGFIGSHAVEALVGAGHAVRLLVRDPAKVERVLGPRGVAVGEVEVVVGDMVDERAVTEAVGGADAVIHSAAAVGVTGGDAARVVATNVDGTRTVLAAAVAAGCDPVIHVSTTAVFVPSPDPVITTDSPLASPRNAYGRSKVDAERVARGFQDDAAPITIVYPGGVFGPDQPTLDSAMEGVAGALEQAWPMPRGGVTIVDVRDLAEILVAACVPGQGPRRLMCGGRFLRWTEFADLCDELTGVRCRRFVVPGWVMTSLGWALDRAKRVKPFDYPLTQDAAEFMVKMVPTDDTPTLTTLGVTYRPTRDTVRESLEWLAAEGHLDPRAAGLLAPPEASVSG